ncbi:hypothetical protein [Aquiflexum sp.]|uniref:hypothetical protein n=1 Tax=Aquiflexum sp. TaxID=1872584 RepID=UPI00359485BE
MNTFLLYLCLVVLVPCNEQNEFNKRVEIFSDKVKLFLQNSEKSNSIWIIPKQSPKVNYSMKYQSIFIVDNLTGLSTCHVPRIIQDISLGLELNLDSEELKDVWEDNTFPLCDFKSLMKLFELPEEVILI